MPSPMTGNPSSDPQEVTVLLQAWTEGDEAALAKLTPLIYDEMRRMARHYMALERSSPTLETGAILNEAFLRLVLLP
ncbi:MAG TPA: ECF-type sigma factor [Terriglobia bacterium]|nr:ECF-type sigma factor [Terriglobia bacterium]